MSSLFPVTHCADCGATSTQNSLTCTTCGSGNTARGGVLKPTKVVPVRSLPLPWPWDGLGAYPEGAVVSLTGGPGSGKSTIAAVVAGAAPSVTWITSEQTPLQVAAFHRRLSLPIPSIGTCSTPGQVRDVLRSASTGFVVLDSLTHMGGWTEQAQILHLLRGWCVAEAGRWGLVIMQVNGQGDAAGLMELPHMVEATCAVSADSMTGLRSLSASKNRNGPLFTRLFGIGPGGLEHVAELAQGASYSIEGGPGAYRLHPWPLPGARWAGLLDKVKPGTGYASAAILAPSYASGVLEPADVEERRTYAVAHGLTWLNPDGDALKTEDKPKQSRKPCAPGTREPETRGKR